MNIVTRADLIRMYGRPKEVECLEPILLTARLYYAGPVLETKARGVLTAAAYDKALSMSNGLLPIKFVLTTVGANENKQVFVEDELMQKAVYESPIGEPIDEDHGQLFRDVCGDIMTSTFQAADARSPAAYIRCGGYIFGNVYPEIAFKVAVGAGRWAAVSMEALPDPLEQVGQYLIVHNPRFVGAGLVRFPGNLYSKIDEVDGEMPVLPGAGTYSQAAVRRGLNKLTGGI